MFERLRLLGGKSHEIEVRDKDQKRRVRDRGREVLDLEFGEGRKEEDRVVGLKVRIFLGVWWILF